MISSDTDRRPIMRPYEAGDIVGGRYEIWREIGRGGMCTVYLATDAILAEQQVALKIVTSNTNPVHLEMLQNEFRILVNLGHENLIRVFDFGKLPKGKGFFYTAEYIEGPDLLEADSAIDEDRLSDYIAQICRALEYVHARGYIHYDVKPANTLVTQKGVVKLMDFGISALAEKGLGKSIRGTPAYTAPEMLIGADVDHRADLFSLGVMLYEIYTGKRPFEGHNLQELLVSIVTETPKPLRHIRPEVPEYLDRIILRMLAKNPADRYDSANAVIKALAKARHEDIELQPESLVEGYLRLPPMCGRDSELDAARSALEKLGRGTGGCISIEGPKGIGCTRLLREIHFEAKLQGYAAAMGEAGDPDLVDKLVGELAAQTEAEEPSEIRSNGAPEQDVDTPRLADKIARIVGFCYTVPVVISIDDIHSALHPTRNAVERLERILGTSDAPPVLLVTSRHDMEDAEAAASPPTVRLRLRSLSSEEVGKVTSRMFGRTIAPELFISRLADATGGNPHAVVEMIRMLVSSGEIAVLEGKWHFRGGAEPFPLPPSLDEFYAMQIDTLPAFQHALALNLALLDRPAKMREVAALNDATAEKIADALENLEKFEIARRTAGLVSITNHGVRDALLKTRSRATLKRRHKLMAEKLAGTRDRKRRSLEIAKHFLLGGDVKRGIRYGLSGIEAGEVVKDRAAAVPILELMRKSLKSASRGQRTKILYAIVEAMNVWSIPEKVIQRAEEYFENTTNKEPKKRLSRTYFTVARCHQSINNPEQARAAWDKALSYVKPGSDNYFEIVVALSGALQYWGQLTECEEMLLEAINRFEHLENSGMMKLNAMLGFMYLRRYNHEDAIKRFDRADEIAREIGEGKTLEMLVIRSTRYIASENPKKAEALLMDARRLALEQKHLSQLALISNNLTIMLFDQNRTEEAFQCAAEAETIWRRCGEFFKLTHLYYTLASTSARITGRARALEYLEKGFECARIAGASLMEYNLCEKAADIYLRCLDLEHAIEYCRKAYDLAESGKMEKKNIAASIRGEALTYSGDLEGAFEFARLGVELALQSKNPSLIQYSRQVICQAAMRAGDFRLALEQLRHIESYVPETLTPSQRLTILRFLADFWLTVGQFERVFKLAERIAADSKMEKEDSSRDSMALLSGKIATIRQQFMDAENAFITANHLINEEWQAASFIEMRKAEVELELLRKDLSAAGIKLNNLESAVSALPGKSVYHGLQVRYMKAYTALIAGDAENAHRMATDSMKEAGGIGFRPLEISFMKIAAAASRDGEEAERLRRNVEALASDMAEPFEESIRENIRKHFCSLPLIDGK
jgi:tetratricopeptide (TPR) repeat protein